MSTNYSKRKSDNQPVSTPRRTRTDGNTRWDAAHNSMTYGPDKPSARTNSSRERVSNFWPDVSKQLEKFTFFWRADSPFSQHHPARFFIDGSLFNCSEQYYMYQKAVTFHDHECARKIMGTSDPAKQKSIAKGISWFNQEIWDNVSYDVVKRANIAKFGENERLLNLLVATRGTELVEASPKDHKWGIGLEADRSEALRRITWRGENKLGRILTEIRDNEFKGVEYQPEKLLHDKLYGYIYFWRSSSPFSPKHLAPFRVENLSFVSLFHYLMFKAAELSGNKRTVDRITREMKQNIIEKEAYKNQLDVHAWRLSLTGNLIEGNFYKFGDNPNLKALLLATNGKMLVFQSRFEGIGNGLEEEDSHDLVTSGDWRGTNLFGSILTFMRDEWIKKPNITLDELKSKELPSYNLREIDLMHMKGVEPPPLKECVDRPQPSTTKPADTKKEEHQKMEVSMWDSDSNKPATTKTNSAANDSTKKKEKKKADKEVEHKSEEASCTKSELCKEIEADDKLKELPPIRSKDKKVQESQDMVIDLSVGDDDDKTEKPDEKSKISKSQKKREDTKKEECQKMEASMRDSDSNKTSTTKTNSAANDSTKKKKKKKADKEVEHKSEEASCNKPELCKESEADDKLKELLPSSSKDKKVQESQDMEMDLSGGDDDDEKTGGPHEKSKKSISQKKREKKRRQKERRK